MKICVIGLGYIGLPTAAIMAVNGHDVLGVDVNRRIVDMINKGQVHIEERGLKTIFNASIQSGRLKAALKPAPADAFVIAVPTPERDHVADLSYLDSAVASVVPHLRKGSLVIVESTIPPHTVERNVIPVLKKTGLEPGKDLHVAHCPERVIPGQTVRELVENDRVLGGLTPECAQKAEAIYKTFVQGRIECCDLCTAETVKLVENSYRDVNIAFANMVSNLCLDFGISSARVIELANMHPRVNILQPGPGVGGHCLPVDPWFLVQENKAKTGLLRVARQINDERPGMIVGKLKKMVGRVKEPKIAVLGVSYKGDVDDVRESPAVEAMKQMDAKKMNVAVYDPMVKNFDRELMTLEDALAGAHAAVILAAHRDFKYLHPEKLGPLMHSRRILDPFGMLDRELWENAGFELALL